VREATRLSPVGPEAGNRQPRWLLEASGGTYTIHGRARLPESARPPRQFHGGSLRWEPLEGDVWRFEAEAGGSAPGDSTIGVVNAIGQVGEAEIELVNPVSRYFDESYDGNQITVYTLEIATESGSYGHDLGSPADARYLGVFVKPLPPPARP
jgi:hypothetical protein